MLDVIMDLIKLLALSSLIGVLGAYAGVFGRGCGKDS